MRHAKRSARTRQNARTRLRIRRLGVRIPSGARCWLRQHCRSEPRIVHTVRGSCVAPMTLMAVQPSWSAPVLGPAGSAARFGASRLRSPPPLRTAVTPGRARRRGPDPVRVHTRLFRVGPGTTTACWYVRPCWRHRRAGHRAARRLEVSRELRGAGGRRPGRSRRASPGLSPRLARAGGPGGAPHGDPPGHDRGGVSGRLRPHVHVPGRGRLRAGDVPRRRPRARSAMSTCSEAWAAASPAPRWWGRDQRFWASCSPHSSGPETLVCMPC